MRAREGIEIACLAAVLGAAACDLPMDARDTLAEATGDTLHVGVTEARPWVVRRGDEAAGVEPELIRQFARSIGAEVHWSWGTAAEHMEALKFYELDVAVGGFTRATPWRKHVGLTQPYHETRVLVAGPPGSVLPGEEALESRDVAVPAGGPIASYVREEEATPRPTDDLSGATGLVAAPDWQLLEIGRDTVGILLTRHRHVMAVPPGENGLLMALENSLHGADVWSLIRRETEAGAPILRGTGPGASTRPETEAGAPSRNEMEAGAQSRHESGGER